MADGILCKRCGHQETEHDGPYVDNAQKRISGRRMSLSTCREKYGYIPEDPELAEKLQQVDEEILERRARGNWAFGLFAAQMRQQRFNVDLGKLNKTIKDAPDLDQKEAAKKAKADFISDCKSTNCLHIGPY